MLIMGTQVSNELALKWKLDASLGRVRDILFPFWVAIACMYVLVTCALTLS